MKILDTVSQNFYKSDGLLKSQQGDINKRFGNLEKLMMPGSADQPSGHAHDSHKREETPLSALRSLSLEMKQQKSTIQKLSQQIQDMNGGKLPEGRRISIIISEQSHSVVMESAVADGDAEQRARAYVQTVLGDIYDQAAWRHRESP